MINSQMYSLNSNPGISYTFLSSFLVPKKVCKSFTSRCVFCNVALFSCSAIKLSTEPTSTNLPDILKIKRRLASFRAKDDKACRTTTFHLWKTSFVQSDAANDDFSLAKFHRSRRWLAATKNRTIFSSLSSVWINLSTYKIKWQFWFCHRASRSKTYFKVPGWCIWHKQMCYLSARQNNAYEEQRSKIKRTLKVLLRSKFNVKFVTKTLSFQLIRSGCTCFGHWSELWRPLSENIEIENDLCSSDKAIVLWLWRHFLNTLRKQTWNVRKQRAILKALLVFARFWNCKGGNHRLRWLCGTSTDWIWESQILRAASLREGRNTHFTKSYFNYAVCAEGDSDYW